MSSNANSRNSHQKREIKIKLFNGKPHKKCCFCERLLRLDNSTIEHILPLSKGGEWNKENLTISCNPCNNERGNRDYLEFKYFKRQQMAELIQKLKIVA